MEMNVLPNFFLSIIICREIWKLHLFCLNEIRFSPKRSCCEAAHAIRVLLPCSSSPEEGAQPPACLCRSSRRSTPPIGPPLAARVPLIMPWIPSTIGSRLRSWLRDYDRIQSLVVLLLYAQIACALLGSLGASHNGVLLVDLVVSLFALVAIESSNQMLGRTYAALLVCAILLDIVWFIFFFRGIWNKSSDEGPYVVFSLKLALWMQIVGFLVRSLSSLLWIQVYRLGVSGVDIGAYAEADYDLRNSFINPPVHRPVRENSISDEVIGGSIYDPLYYSSLFEDVENRRHIHEDIKQKTDRNGDSASTAAGPQLKACVSKSFQINDVDSGLSSP